MSKNNLTKMISFSAMFLLGIITIFNEEFAQNKFGLTGTYNIYFGVFIILIAIGAMFSYYILYIKK